MINKENFENERLAKANRAFVYFMVASTFTCHWVLGLVRNLWASLLALCPMADNSMFGALDQLQSGDKAYVYTPDGCCREYTVYENSVVSKSDKIFQKGWRDEKRKQVLTLATCPSRRSDINRRIVNAELNLQKRQ